MQLSQMTEIDQQFKVFAYPALFFEQSRQVYIYYSIIIEDMVEIIHHYNGGYPFGLEKESQNTFMQVSKTNLTEDQIMFQRQKAKIYRNINSQHFIKLIKTLKEDSNLHFIYQYETMSIENYIQNLKKAMEGTLSKETYKFLITQFKNNIDSIIDILIKFEIKADVFLSYVACISNYKKEDTLILKAFIDPSAEYLSLYEHNYRSKEGKKKDKSGINQQFLNQFYEAQRKRLMLEFEEILEKNFGKLHQSEAKKQFPNFVISGTKLVFLNPDEKERENFTEIQGKVSKTENIKVSEGVNEKYISKMEESKKTGVSERSRNSSPAGEKQFIREIKSTGNNILPIQPNVKSPTGPIIDFDQSFQPEFKPEEFLKEKTYIYEEDDDYLNSLQEQLHHMALEKKGNIAKKNSLGEGQMKKEVKEEIGNNKQKIFIPEKKEKIKPKDLTNSQGNTQNNTYYFNNPPSQGNQNNLSKESGSISNKSQNNNLSNSSINNDSEGVKSDSPQSKGDKMNKYKMKIITSHQIEIQGGNEQPNVQQIQKQIMQQIKAGKININDLGNEKPSQLMINCKAQKNDSKEKPTYTISMYNSDHREENKSKDSCSSQTKGKVRHDSDGGDDSSEGKVSYTTKMKNISQILEKIGVKNNNSASQHNRKYYPETHNSQVNSQDEPQNPVKKIEHEKTVKKTEFQKAVKKIEPEKSAMKKTEAEKQVRKAGQIPTIPNMMTPQHRIQKTEPNQQQKKVQNYADKMRQAKSKAQQLLKQFTKKKQ